MNIWVIEEDEQRSACGGQGNDLMQRKYDMLLNPIREIFAAKLTTRYGQNNFLLLVNRGGELVAVQDQHRFQGGMPYSLVAIQEWVILNEKVPERCGLLYRCRVKILITERLERLQD